MPHDNFPGKNMYTYNLYNILLTIFKLLPFVNHGESIRGFQCLDTNPVATASINEWTNRPRSDLDLTNLVVGVQLFEVPKKSWAISVFLECDRRCDTWIRASFFLGGGAICFSERILSMSNPKQHWICENHPKSDFSILNDPIAMAFHTTLQIFTLHKKKRDNEPRSFKRLLKESKIKSLATSYKCLNQKKLKKHWDISNFFSLQPWIPIFKKKKGKKRSKKTRPQPQLVCYHGDLSKAFKETTSWTSTTSTPEEGKMAGPPTPHNLEIRPN